MSGPTQTATVGQAHNAWEAHPRAAATVRVLVVVAPVLLSFGFSWFGARVFPPDRVDLPLWQWWVLLAAASMAVLRLARHVAQRFAPLAAMLQLTLIFPDEAPSRMRTALRKGNSKAMLRRLEELPDDGEQPPTELILSLLKSLNTHDPLTRGHSERVRAYTDLIAEQLELPEDDVNKLRWGALLHDVGKLEVPSEILQSKGRPTEEEWEILKTHPAHSATILRPLAPWLGDWVLAGEEHHLRWDGGGYPNSKAGTEISLAGRIVAVADAYDVMTSARSYKKGLPPAAARDELARCAGSQFDPTVVRAFLAVGIGRLRAVLGPLGWFAGVFDALRLPLAPAAVANAAASTAVAVAVTAGGVTGLVTGDEEPDPEPAAAREVETGEDGEQVDAVDGWRNLVVIEDTALTFGVDVPAGGEPVYSWDSPGHGTLTSTGGGLRYTPDPDYSGPDLVMITACVGDVCITTTVVIDVRPVNDLPVPGEDEATVVSGGSVELPVLLNDTDVEGEGLSIELIGSPVHGTATTDGTTIIYTPAPGFVGVDWIEYIVIDASGGRAVARVKVTVTGPTPTTTLPPPPPPLPPSGPTAAADLVTVLEDGTVLVPVLDNDVPGAAPLGTTVSIVTPPGDGIAALGPGGTIRYTPTPDSVGSDLFTYRVTDLGGRVSASAAVTVTIVAVNDAPIFSGGGPVVVDADSPAVALPWATGISPGPVDESGQSLSFDLVVDRPELFAAGPVIDAATGELRFTPVGSVTGTARVSATLRDDGGTANGGTDTTTPVDFTVRVNALPVAAADTVVTGEDTAAVIAVLANDTDAEDGIPGGAVVVTGPTKGTAVVNPDRTVTYTPDPDANGDDFFAYRVDDADGASSALTGVSVLITPVNDAPTWVDAGDPAAVLEDAGAQTVAAWATAISAGPANESAQTLTFNLTANSNPGLFSVAPSVDETSGDLTFTAAGDANGTADLTFTLSDNGGTANGGDDTSVDHDVTITVTAVNDEPSFTKGADVTVARDSGAASFTGWATSISTGPADESGQTLTFVEVASNPGLFGTPPKVDEVTGELTFTPAAGVSGVSDVDITLSDNGGTANGGDDTSPTVTIQITVTAPGEDFDGVAVGSDNCPTTFNVDQFDSDGDGTGDACDATPTVASTGTLTDTGQALASAKSFDIALGDLDGDGDLDLIAANEDDDTASVWWNDGGGTFTDSGQVLVADKPVAVAVGDLDGDGDLDAAFAHESRPNTVWFNDGAGVFTDSGQTLGSSQSEDVVLGDVDGDGDLDIAVANRGEPNRVWRNDGAGVFTDSGQAMGTAKSMGLAFGDVDGDTDLDLVFVNDQDPDTVWLNNGSGTFTDSGQSLSDRKGFGVALGDVDGDGDLDIAVAVDNEDNTIWINDGSGTFTDSGQILSSSNHNIDLAFGDIDGDGDLDLVFADDSNPNTVWINNGAGVFTDSTQALGASTSKAVALGDLDGDGDLDLVVGNDGDPNRVYRNS